MRQLLWDKPAPVILYPRRKAARKVGVRRPWTMQEADRAYGKWLRCDTCGRMATRRNRVVYSHDPFQAEINDNWEEYQLCARCLDESRASI
mgnify:CR=1 FL=1